MYVQAFILVTQTWMRQRCYYWYYYEQSSMSNKQLDSFHIYYDVGGDWMKTKKLLHALLVICYSRCTTWVDRRSYSNESICRKKMRLGCLPIPNLWHGAATSPHTRSTTNDPSRDSNFLKLILLRRYTFSFLIRVYQPPSAAGVAPATAAESPPSQEVVYAPASGAWNAGAPGTGSTAAAVSLSSVLGSS